MPVLMTNEPLAKINLGMDVDYAVAIVVFFKYILRIDSLYILLVIAV
jgi:hypothetical protein